MLETRKLEMESNRSMMADAVRPTIYCNYCRQLNPNDANFCSACGRSIKLSLESVEPTASSSPAVGARPTEPIQPKKELEGDKGVAPLPRCVPATASPEVFQNLRGHNWKLEKMTDEELQKLRDSYEKRKIETDNAVQRELERRRNTQVISEVRQSKPVKQNESAEPKTAVIWNGFIGQRIKATNKSLRWVGFLFLLASLGLAIYGGRKFINVIPG